MKPVLALAALLLVALIGLVVWITKSDSPREAAPPPVTAAKPPEPTPSSPVSSVEPSEDRKRELDQIAGSSAATDPRKAPSTYAVGDAIVHDRRGDGGGPPRTSPVRAPTGIGLSAQFAGQVTDVMKPAAKQCISSLPEDSRNEKTKLNVTMTVRVKNGSLTVSDVAAKVDGLDETALAPALACLRQQMVGSTVAAAGEPDVDAYPITTYYTP